MNLWQGKKKIPENPIIFFQGNFLWLQNTEAAQILAKEIFPKIRKEVPEAVCRIVGQGATEKIGHLEGGGVQVHDLEAADIEGVRKAYEEATVFLAPLAGPGGTRLKILGAMASGVPVVTTTTGIEGIDAQDDKEVLIRNQPEEMAEAAVRLLREEDYYKKMVDSARGLVEKNYNWPNISRVLDKIYKEVGGGRKS